MTLKEKVTYMGISFALIHIGLKDIDVEKIVLLYEAVLEKKGSMTIKDVANIETEVEERYKHKIK